jgi:hypothetical protein
LDNPFGAVILNYIFLSNTFANYYEVETDLFTGSICTALCWLLPHPPVFLTGISLVHG